MNCLWTARWSWICVNTCNSTINSILSISMAIDIHTIRHNRLHRDSVVALWHCIDGSVQDYSISIANAVEILQSCNKPSISLSFQPDACVIDGMCYVLGDMNGNSVTQICIPSLDQTGWSTWSGTYNLIRHIFCLWKSQWYLNKFNRHTVESMRKYLFDWFINPSGYELSVQKEEGLHQCGKWQYKVLKSTKTLFEKWKLKKQLKWLDRNIYIYIYIYIYYINCY